MKNKGFTLIELLATITILSIILLITFASVGSVITNSKKNLHDSQINQIEKAAEYYNNKEGLKDYNTCINVEDLIDKGYIKQDEIKDPKGGNDIGGSVKINYNGKKYSYKYDNKLCIYSFINLDEDSDNDGEVSIGDKYTYQVNDTDTFNFYVLSIEDNQVNLIMNRNICDDGTITYTETNSYCNYKWYSSSDDNTYGPTTVMQALYAGTKDWNNVDNMIMNYTDENNVTANDMGYTSIITTNGITRITGKPTSNTTTVGTTSQPLKARLPKESEVTGAGCTTSAGSCPVWLMEYMTYSNQGNDKYSMNNNSEAYQDQINGYWLLSSFPVGSQLAHRVCYDGSLDAQLTRNGHIGMRPVITLPISVFDQR